MIKIKSIKLMNEIQKQLKTNNIEFFEAQLLEIKKIAIDPVGFNNVYEAIDFTELLYLKNLEVVDIFSMALNKETLSILCNLKSLMVLNFHQCNIESLEPLSKIDLYELGLYDTAVDNINCINNLLKLKNLYLENIGEIELIDLNVLVQLRSLSLSNSSIFNIDFLKKAIDLEYLQLDNTGIKQISFVAELQKLKTLVLDNEQAIANTQLIKKLALKGNLKIINERNKLLGDSDVK